MRDEVGGMDVESLPCYEFNLKLRPLMDDGLCEHCRKWLTVDCDNIDEFVDEEDWEDDF